MFNLPEIEILKCSSADRFISLYARHGARLTNYWLGRKIVAYKASCLRNLGAFTEEKILKTFQEVIESGASASSVWQLYKEFHQTGLYANDKESSGCVWKYLKDGTKTSSWLHHIYHQITNIARVTFRTLGYYFGFDPKYLFAAKSFWDMEQRFTSLQNLAGILVTASLGIYQAVHLSSALFTALPLQGLVWAKVLIVSAVAIASILGLGCLFYKLGKWLGGAPVELWKCKNLTFEMGKIKSSVSFGREKELAELIGCLASQSASIVMIQAEAGAGKTCLVKELARSLARDPLPSSMKRPQLFLLNAAQIDSSNFSSLVEKLEVIKDQIEGYESEIILAIDEVHLLDQPCIEQLKQWKDEGLRLIFLTNSEEKHLKERWKEAYDSLLSHTQSTTIRLDENSKSVLEAIIEHQLSLMPHVSLDEEVKSWMIKFFAEKKGAPRLLKMLLEKVGSMELAFQSHQEAILKLSQEINELQKQIQQESLKGSWQKAEAIVQGLQEKINERKNLLKESDSRKTSLERRRKSQEVLTQLRSHIGNWVKESKMTKKDRRFLASLETTLTRVSFRQAPSFASRWTVQRLEKLTSLNQSLLQAN